MPSPFIVFQRIVPQHFISRVVGVVANSKLLSKPFIYCLKRYYQVDLTEAVIQNPKEFPTFNDFFTRALKPDARPLPEDQSVIVSPADGEISQAGDIRGDRIFQAKGHDYSIGELLACNQESAKKFEEGKFCTVYLSPRDYHRVHMPFCGKLMRTTYVPGELYSVNRKTAESIPNLFARNERLVCYFETDIGEMAVVLVGAMIVAGIETVWSGHVCPTKNKRSLVNQQYEKDSIVLDRGEELGRFKLGSTAILLFGKNTLALDNSIVEGQKIRMGEQIATTAS